MLYVDLLGLHQIHPIQQVTIDNAPDLHIRQFLIDEKHRRDRSERTDKVMIGAILGVDLFLIVWVVSGFLDRRAETWPSH
jgi:hypothetical protein